jgi:hypothetical protein
MFDSVQLNAVDAVNALMKDLGFNRSSRWYVVKRVRREGVAFVTVVLPSLAKHILRCLEVGCWSPFKGPSPVKTSGRQRYTAFLADELTCIFESPLNPDCALNLWRVRQVLEYFYKLALEFDPGCLDQATEKFLETESSLDYDREFADQVRRSAEKLFPTTQKLTFDDVARYARFGPGTFSGHLSGHYAGDNLQAKKDLLDGCYPLSLESSTGGTDSHLSDHLISPRSNPLYGHSGHFRKAKTSIYNPVARFGIALGTSLNFLVNIPLLSLIRTTVSGPVRCKPYIPDVTYSELLFVPKDSRGPRTIVREPAHNLFIQMGLHEAYKKSLERDTNGRIQFISQEEFRNLAARSSKTREYATLDLSEASDSVSAGLACAVFQNFPAFSTSFKYYRTANCMLPNGDMHSLRKLSGMGSGFTFPIMAAIIYAAIYTGIPKYSRRETAPLIYVYGDDIIVPTKWVARVKRALSRSGFTVNAHKSYYRSYFRESCGGDYYLGENIAPVRLKLDKTKLIARGSKVWSKGSDNSQKTVFKLERHCRELVKNGLLNLASYYYNVIEQYLDDELVIGTRYDATPLIRYTLGYVPCKWNNPPLVSVYKPQIPTKSRCDEGKNLSFHQFLTRKDEVIFEDPTLIGLTADRNKVGLKLTDVDLSFVLG